MWGMRPRNIESKEAARGSTTRVGARRARRKIKALFRQRFCCHEKLRFVEVVFAIVVVWGSKQARNAAEGPRLTHPGHVLARACAAAIRGLEMLWMKACTPNSHSKVSRALDFISLRAWVLGFHTAPAQIFWGPTAAQKDTTKNARLAATATAIHSNACSAVQRVKGARCQQRHARASWKATALRLLACRRRGAAHEPRNVLLRAAQGSFQRLLLLMQSMQAGLSILRAARTGYAPRRRSEAQRQCFRGTNVKRPGPPVQAASVTQLPGKRWHKRVHTRMRAGGALANEAVKKDLRSTG